MMCLLMLVLSLITTSVSQWHYFDSEGFTSPRSIKFSSDYGRLIVGGKYLDVYETETLTNYPQQIDPNIGSKPISKILSLKLNKNEDSIAYAGDSSQIYFTPFPQVQFNTIGSISSGNTKIYEIDFSNDGSKILSCGDKFVNIQNASNGFFFKVYPVTSTKEGRCSYSDVEDRAAFSYEYDIKVINKDYSDFYEASIASLGKVITSIKFMKGYAYPLILVDKLGIIKTAKSVNDWQIINYESTFTTSSMSISEDGKQIAIGGTLTSAITSPRGRTRIYKTSQFQSYIAFNTSTRSYYYVYDTISHPINLDLSKNGKILALAFETGSFYILIKCYPNIRLQWNCDEVCGDDYVIQRPCDLSLGNDYDGCTDNCTVQQDFSCINNLTTNKSFCIYQGNLSLRLVSIQKNLLLNQHSIVLSIFPPVYSLKNLNLTDDQLTKLFIFPPKFKVISSSFNENSSEVSLVFSAIQEMENQKFYIDFYPSVIGKQQYFASKSYRLELTDKQNSVIMPIYFSNDFLFTISQIISYSCVFICIVGWLLFLVGLFFKSLTGIQTLMTFQFCGLTLHWLKCRFFMAISYANNIKYLSGYNFLFQSQNVAVTQQVLSHYSILNKFDIDLNFFANNLNLTLFIFIPFLFAFLVIRLLIFMELRKINDSCKVKIEKLKQYKLLAVDSLLYSMLCIYVPFLEFFILFVETGQITHVASWVISLSYLLLLILVLLIFYQNPSNFETFWFSFRLHRIHLHHFFFYILSFTLAIVFLIKLPNFPYVAGIPCLFMFIYTFVVHPYSSLKENIRSALNYLIMCSFVVFNILVIKMPSQQISSNTVYCFLGINIVVLLPLASILALLSNAYHCYKRFYVIPKSIAKQSKDQEVDQKILQQLNKANVIKKMSREDEQNNFFKHFIVANESIFDCSNRLILENEGIHHEESQNNEYSTNQHPQVKGQPTKKKFQKIKDLKKKIMLSLQTERKGVNESRENAFYFRNIEYLESNLNDEHEEELGEENKQANLVKQKIFDENFYINTKRVVQKTENEIKDRVEKQQENIVYLDIYEKLQ